VRRAADARRIRSDEGALLPPRKRGGEPVPCTAHNLLGFTSTEQRISPYGFLSLISPYGFLSLVSPYGFLSLTITAPDKPFRVLISYHPRCGQQSRCSGTWPTSSAASAARSSPPSPRRANPPPPLGSAGCSRGLFSRVIRGAPPARGTPAFGGGGVCREADGPPPPHSLLLSMPGHGHGVST
jgi:hypothetical protein